MLLADQDRGRWDRGLIAEGQAIVRRCLRRNQPGPVPDPGGDQRRPQRRADRGRHRLARRSCSCTTSCWRSRPSPVVALNRAVAVAEVDGPGGGARPRRRPRPRRATTCSTPSAPTCSAASAATPRRPWRTTRRSPAPRTRPSATSCGAVVKPSPGRAEAEAGSEGVSSAATAGPATPRRHTTSCGDGPAAVVGGHEVPQAEELRGDGRMWRGRYAEAAARDGSWVGGAGVAASRIWHSSASWWARTALRASSAWPCGWVSGRTVIDRWRSSSVWAART